MAAAPRRKPNNQRSNARPSRPAHYGKPQQPEPDQDSDYEPNQEPEEQPEEQLIETQPQRPVYQRPAPQQTQPARQSWNGGNRQSGGRNSQGKDGSVRVSGFFPSRREGLSTGKLRAQDIEGLLTLLESARGSGAEISLFLWENLDGRQGPAFTLTAAVSQDQRGGGQRIGRSSGGYR